MSCNMENKHLSDAGFIQCPFCGFRHVPTTGPLVEGAYCSRCQACGHQFKFRACLPYKSTVTFTVNGKQYTVGNGYSSTTSLNMFLRESGVSRGTKVMCHEGGCGCCVVTVSLYNILSSKMEPYSVNSCLCPLYVCDGWSITTVEGLGSQQSGLHPIQQQLVDDNGSQCGFCSSGMVMNMYSLLERTPNPTVRMIENHFDGNICRCTGYRPILDAMKSFGKATSTHDLDIEDLDKRPCMGRSSTDSCANRTVAPSIHMVLAKTQWYRPSNLDELYQILINHKTDNIRLTFGSTASGVYGDMGPWAGYNVLVDMHNIKELYAVSFDTNVILGANLSLSVLMEIFQKSSSEPSLPYLADFVAHLAKVAHVPVRNAGCWAGNLMIKHTHPEFPSDIFLLFETVGTTLSIGPGDQTKQYTLIEFLSLNMKDRVIQWLILPTFEQSKTVRTVVRTYKVSPRSQNSQAYVNCGIRMHLDFSKNYAIQEKPNIVFGGLNKAFIHATKTEDYLVGKQLGDPSTLKGALEILSSEVNPEDDPVFGSAAYKKQLALSFLYKYFLSTCGERVAPRYISGGQILVRPVSSGLQTYDTQKMEWPVTEPLAKLEGKAQVTGEAEYIADIPPVPGQLYAAFVLSTVGNATLVSMDPSKALEVPGVVQFIAASDIPVGGVNNCMPAPYAPEEVLCSHQVLYAGQALALIVADSEITARQAAGMVEVTYADKKPPILSIPDAIEKKSFFPKQADALIIGDAEKAIASSARSLSGSISLGAQYHFQMETQISRCSPTEDGMHVISSTQWLDYCQQAVSITLGIPNNSVDMEVRRLGGAFGSKISRNFQVASGCALAAYITNKPVVLQLDFAANMKMVGKRFPWQADYLVGFTADGKLNGVKMTYYCDCGCSPNDGELVDVMAFADNAYQCDNWHLIPIAVKTNCPSHTYCRAPGSTASIFIIETIMEHIAKSLSKDPTEVKTLNLYQKGQVTPQGMHLEYCSIRDLVSDLDTSAQVKARMTQVTEFNKENRWKKKGLSVVPLKYGTLWTGSNYNVFVSIYNGDGTVAISHGGVESGQGINTKVAQVCAYELGIPMNLIKIKPSNNMTGANSYTTGGSVTSELNCQAVMECCGQLKERMAPVKAKMKDPSWRELVQKCFSEGVDLCARYWLFLKTLPDRFQYNSYGVTCTEAELDVLTGETMITRVDILFDCGESINPNLDVGQVEGAFVMGLGYWLLEKTAYDPTTGQNVTSNTWTYKVPSSADIPVDFRVHLLKNAPNPLGVLRSKITGEPPLCMSCSALFALKHAVEAARTEIGKDTYFPLGQPATVEKLQTECLVDNGQLLFGPD